MATPVPAPGPDPIVEQLFLTVLKPPDGHTYHCMAGQLLFPVFGGSQWRLLLCDTKSGELTPVFIEGQFIFKLMRALHAMQRELNTAVGDSIGEPVQRTQVQ